MNDPNTWSPERRALHEESVAKAKQRTAFSDTMLRAAGLDPDGPATWVEGADRQPYQPSMTLIDRELAPITAVLADLERRAKFVLDALLSAEHDLSFGPLLAALAGYRSELRHMLDAPIYLGPGK